MNLNNVALHTRGCNKIPRNDEFSKTAVTMTIAQMARRWVVSATIIKSRLKHLGIKSKPQYGNPLSEEQIATIVRMYQANNPLHEISYRVKVSDDRLRLEVKLLIKSQVLSLRPVITRTKVPRESCNICDARLDYNYDRPSTHRLCGLCRFEFDLPPDEFLERSRFLAAAVLDRAIKDSKSNNGVQHEAAQWLVSRGAGALFDLVDVISQDEAVRFLNEPDSYR